jgi:hypothetical protein
MTRLLSRLLVITLALAPAAVAHADEATARKNFEAGERAYNLGQFDRAAELFAKAYEEWPEPAFLFNLAPTYRQAGNCQQASFFYKRFLALKENDTKKPIKPTLKAEVENRIVELDECIKRELASRPPTALDNGTTSTTTTTTPTSTTSGTQASGTQTAAATGVKRGADDDDEGDDDDDDIGIRRSATAQPSLVSVRLGVGAGKLSAGDLDVPVQFAGSFIAAYPLALADKLTLDVGAALSFTPVPYTTATNTSGTAALIGILANAGPTYTVMPKLAVRADVGVGVQVFSGLGMDGNPFTVDGNPATGPLSSLLVRVALSGEYEVMPNLLVTLTPVAFSYSPAPDGFDPSISALTTFSALAGVAYRR